METVRAAGAVVWHDGPDGPVVACIHRPAYDDWSFPKGKLDPGEDEATAALREIEEETGLICRLGAELDTISYTDGKGRPKTVRYWLATTDDPAMLAADNEVDEARWVPVREAEALLTYERDRALLSTAVRAAR